MASQETSAIVYMEKLMHHVSPHLGKASYSKQIIHIDHMFAEHSHKSAKHEHFIRKANIGYAVAAADTYHRSVEAWFVRLFRLVMHISINVASDERTSLLSVLNHLRHRTSLAFRNKKDVVAYNVDIVMIYALQLVVSYDPLAAFLFHIKLANEIGAFNPGCPDDSVCFKLVVSEDNA
ncbi:hypothetical protein D1872_238580 [compost metagenome]